MGGIVCQFRADRGTGEARMMNSGVAIRYGDVAPEAKENFTPSVSEKASFVDLSQLQRYNLNFTNYANPCELYSVVLDGGASAFPSAPENANLGLWSEQISGDDGAFASPIVLTLTSSGQYSSQGFTFTFDTYNNIHPTHINIHWWRDTAEAMEDLGAMDFYPDNAFYFCRNKVENYNRVVITFTALNMPYNRLKLRVVDYGYGTIFYGSELRNVKNIQEINPISSELSINTTDFTLDSKTDMDYSFQAKQPLSIYFNGELKATTFVKKSTRKAKRLWDIQSEDYIGLMDSIPYAGGMYFGQDAYALLVDIFTMAKVPYSINEDLKGVLVDGYIPFTTCREALMQVTFAVQNVVDTSNSENVNVVDLKDEVKQTIPLNRIMQGQSFTDDETVTDVEVVCHTYKAITESVEVYNASESGTGTNILVKFSEPLHDLSITKGTIVVGTTNYAIINANTGCVLSGQKYEHTTVTHRKRNPVVLASEIEKIVTIENATLVSSQNINMVLEKCYNWLIKTNTTNLKIVEGKHASSEGDITYDQPVNVGEVIKSETEYLGEVTGRIIKQSFSLNGGIIVKEAVLK